MSNRQMNSTLDRQIERQIDEQHPGQIDRGINRGMIIDRQIIERMTGRFCDWSMNGCLIIQPRLLQKIPQISFISIYLYLYVSTFYIHLYISYNLKELRIISCLFLKLIIVFRVIFMLLETNTVHMISSLQNTYF